jgi:predicted ATP-dependent endonuclease of OLD family
MPLKKINLENFTVFDSVDIEFSKGINVLIGENGTGKTHVLKVLYSACKAAQAKTSGMDFPTKLTRVFRPDGLALHRLVRRGMGDMASKVEISFVRDEEISDYGAKDILALSIIRRLKMEFHAKHKKNIAVIGEKSWIENLADLTSIFIPAKEILSNSRNLIQAIEQGNVDFDDTYKDIISTASVNLTKGPVNEIKRKYLEILQTVMTGTVSIKKEQFYLKPGNQSMLEFQLVAEGIRKIALLWQLIKNGTLEKGSILFWDEPEANINPVHIPVLADMLLELQRDGVQIFVATHDYFVAKYLGVRRTEGDNIRYHSLYQDKKSVLCESADSFEELRNNRIMDTFIALYKEEIDRAMKS